MHATIVIAKVEQDIRTVKTQQHPALLQAWAAKSCRAISTPNPCLPMRSPDGWPRKPEPALYFFHG